MVIVTSDSFSSEDLQWLRKQATGGLTSRRLAERCQIVLLASEGKNNEQIAALLGITRQKAARWRKRFQEGGRVGLEHDVPGRGRKPVYGPEMASLIVDRTLRTNGQRGTADYTLWGERTVVAAGAGVVERGYTGHHWHSESGLHLTLFRAYDADLARWASRDPLKYAEIMAGPNLYGYVRNSPSNQIDTDGRLGQVAVGAIFGGVFSASAEIFRQIANDPSTPLDCLNWKNIGGAALAGAIGGAISGATFGLGTAVGAGFVGGAGTGVGLSALGF